MILLTSEEHLINVQNDGHHSLPPFVAPLATGSLGRQPTDLRLSAARTTAWQACTRSLSTLFSPPFPHSIGHLAITNLHPVWLPVNLLSPCQNPSETLRPQPRRTLPRTHLPQTPGPKRLHQKTRLPLAHHTQRWPPVRQAVSQGVLPLRRRV